jgi:membrane-bound lytic murein transglycosylase B
MGLSWVSFSHPALAPTFGSSYLFLNALQKRSGIMVLPSCRRCRLTCLPPHRRRTVFVLVWLLGAITFLLPAAVRAEGNDFDTWLQDLRAEAQKRGIRNDTLDAALTGLKPLPRVIELDRNQPESTLTYAQYHQLVVPQSRVMKGRALLNAHRDLLRQIETQYGVPPHVVLALWGIESDFGLRTGGFQTIAVLATLAYDGRRGIYFRRELLNALRILDDGHIAMDMMTGSWAGAMGQSQFMPSSFLNAAVDFDGDGRRDIWTNLGDVFASTANYLVRAGWHPGETWGQRVTLPNGLDRALVDLNVKKSVDAWQELGVRGMDGGPLIQTPSPQASLVLPSEGDEPAFLVFHNFRVFLKWNRSTYFALAVGQLSDQIRRGP